jgi:predicted acetyltransferase
MTIYYWDKPNTSELYHLWYNIFHDSKSFCDYYFAEKLIDNKVIVAQENSEIVSQVHMNPYELSLSNRQISCYYIVGVSTKESYRGNGLARKLITKSISDLYDEKCEFIFLTTVDENIYTKYNFRYITSCLEGQFIKTKNRLPLANPPIALNLSISKAFYSYYVKKMQNTYNGYIVRDDYYISRIIKEMECENGSIQLFYKDNTICGYIMLYIFEDSIQIREMLYDNSVLIDILSYLQNIMADHKTVSFVLPYDFNLASIFQNYFISTFVIKPYIMARLVYIKTFLQAITSSAPIKFNLQIMDSIIEQNNRTFLWDISINSSSITETNLPADIIIDIGVLTQWLCGYIHIEELIALNKIEIKNNTIRASLSQIKTLNPIWINEVV